MSGRGVEAPEDEDVPSTSGQQDGIIFVLENANLETAHVGKTYQLLNCDDHKSYLLRHGKDPSQYRPDIAHQGVLTLPQALLAIIDSPLNKAGRIKAVYVRTAKNVLIEVNPAVRLPRTFKRFCGLFVQLLQKLSIRATNGPSKLLRVVKGPVTKYFPPGAERVGFSHKAELISGSLQGFVKELPEGKPVVFTVGAFAHGKIDVAYTDRMVSISGYPLSAACCISKITNALEWKWSIV